MQQDIISARHINNIHREKLQKQSNTKFFIITLIT